MAKIRAARNAEPFQPFALRTEAGNCFAVVHPDRIAYHPQGTTVVVCGSVAPIHFLELADIAAIDVLPSPAPARLDDLPDLFA